MGEWQKLRGDTRGSGFTDWGGTQGHWLWWGALWEQEQVVGRKVMGSFEAC